MLSKEQEKIFRAIINQDLGQLENFINEKNDCSFTDDEGNTLLHFASDRIGGKTLPIVQLLLENGCDAQSVNCRFETPIDRAKQNNNIPALTVMKHYINIKNKNMENLAE